MAEIHSQSLPDGGASHDAPASTDASVRPLVSVILAVCNEAKTVEACVASILGQSHPDFDLEILAVDGGSTDGTRQILETIAASEPPLRVLKNESRRTPFAFNLGLREAAGEYVCIFGAHTDYSPDYISTCLRELRERGATGCGGRVVTQPTTGSLQARLVAATLAHPFGSSHSSFRTQSEGFADTVNYPVLKKAALLEVGGYDETLLRNQDNDMNQRLRAAGNKLYCTWNSRCYYHPPGTVRALLRYAYRNGFWNVISLRKNAACMAARHFVPFVFVTSLLATAALAIGWRLGGTSDSRLAALAFLLILGSHLAVGAYSAVRVALRDRFSGALWLPSVFLGLHLAYGLGTLAAFISGAGDPRSAPSKFAGRSFANRHTPDQSQV